MSEKNFGYLGTTFQQQLLKTIIDDKKYALTIIDTIESKFFDGPYFKYLMENIRELYRSFGAIPSYETLEQKIMLENKDVTSKVHIDTLHSIRDLVMDETAVRFVKKTALNFCKQQVVKKAIKQIEEINANGNFEEYNRIENIIVEALQVGVSTDVVDAFENVRESLAENNRVPYPTGITGIDGLLNGGLAKGEFGLFIAPTGVGKTTFLTKVANSAFNNGANVLQVFFEDGLNDIRRKHYTLWTRYNEAEQKLHEDEVVETVESVGMRSNFLKFLKLPPYGVTVADIRSHVRKLASEGFKVDVMIVDYLECISGESTATGDEWKGEGAISRSLESMKDEFGMAIWAGTQGNRESISSEVVTTDQIGGSIKKAQIGTVVISAGKTLQQKEHNLATVTLLKSRIGKDGIVFQNCKFNNEYLDIDTETQVTLLGLEEEEASKKEKRAHEVYKARHESDQKLIEQSVEKVLESKISLLNRTHENIETPESENEIGHIELKDDAPILEDKIENENEPVTVEVEVTLESSVDTINTTFTVPSSPVSNVEESPPIPSVSPPAWADQALALKRFKELQALKKSNQNSS